MNSTVFMIDNAGGLTELSHAEYDSEDLFQKLLAEHPALLGSAGGPTGRLLLVRREAPVPEAQDGPGRWSLDHLFLDGDGVPVLVEVKRATDTRARREVVAQMLDYAANGVAYWPVDQIIEAFNATVTKTGGEPDQRLAEFLGDQEPDSFWRQVDANLRSGRVRMVFVADRIQQELRRIVEFLNEQMRPAEVLAIEVAQFTAAGGVRLLTPKLIGATERAVSAKAVTPPKPPIDEAGWIESLRELKGGAAAANAGKLLDWFKARGFLTGVTDSQDAMFARLVRPDGKPTWPFFIRRSSGKVETALQYLQDNPAFATEEVRLDLLAKLKALPGVNITTTKSTGWPGVPLVDLSRDAVWAGFAAIAEEVQARSSAAG
ncbi:hypothetical protein [Phenylobacterium sp.]|uniref:hypothetical protein n=1 Tax=Phenylobacterium sp. TaxID=1871053 RepID=UPI0035B33FD1